jgi:hypothetical protein
VVSFLDAFLNQFFGDILIVFRAHGRSSFACRHKRHLPIASRFFPRRGLLRVRCSTGQVLARAGPVEIIWSVCPSLRAISRDRSSTICGVTVPIPSVPRRIFPLEFLTSIRHFLPSWVNSSLWQEKRPAFQRGALVWRKVVLRKGCASQLQQSPGHPRRSPAACT